MAVTGFQNVSALREVKTEYLSMGYPKNKFSGTNLQWIVAKGIFPHMLSHPIGNESQKLVIIEHEFLIFFHADGYTDTFGQGQDIIKSGLSPQSGGLSENPKAGHIGLAMNFPSAGIRIADAVAMDKKIKIGCVSAFLGDIISRVIDMHLSNIQQIAGYIVLKMK